MLGATLAWLGRHAPFETGRWRIGALASRLVRHDPRDVQVAIRSGQRMGLNLGQFVDRELYCTGLWEPNETALVERLLKPGDRVIDVGANIGYFALLAARLVGASGHVDAIEATPPTAARLRDNVALNALGQVQVHAVAVGDREGMVSLVEVAGANAGANRLSAGAPGEAVARRWSVPMVRLETLATHGPYRLIKLDIEGAEAMALRGAGALLDGGDPPDLLLEYAPAMMNRLGDDPDGLRMLLQQRGYACHGLHGNHWRPIDLAEVGADACVSVFATCSPERAQLALG